MSKSSAQLEREAEQTRAELAATLAELRERMSPGQVFDEVLDYARDGTLGDFARNLRRQVGSNPVPAALAGLGLAWLMMSAGRATRRGPSASATTDEWSAGARDIAARGRDDGAHTAPGMSDGVIAAAGSAADKARRTMHDMRDTFAGAAESAAETASSAASRLTAKAKAAGAAFGSVAGDAQVRVASGGRGLFDFVSAQPLVLAGIGVAIGAALGAALPATRAENKLMGEKSDELKERVGEMAGEQLGKAEEVAGSVYQHVKKEAEKFGLKTGDQSASGHRPGPPFGDRIGQRYGAQDPVPSVRETVSTAPSGDGSPVPASEEVERDRSKRPSI